MKKQNDPLQTATKTVDARMQDNPTIPGEARTELIKEEYDTLLWDDYSDYGDDTTGLFGCDPIL